MGQCVRGSLGSSQEGETAGLGYAEGQVYGCVGRVWIGVSGGAGAGCIPQSVGLMSGLTNRCNPGIDLF